MHTPQIVDLSPSPFVGRTHELEALAIALDPPGCCVTVWGPPGVGKTRLTLHQLRATSSPAAVVAASSCVDRGGFLSALCAALDVVDTGEVTSSALGFALGALAARGGVLVVDGAEALRDELRAVIPVLRAAAPSLCCVLTSREPMELPGERLVRVPPLPESDALALLRAGLAARGADPRPGDASTLRELVKALDGLPLVIELATHFAAFLGPQEALAWFGQDVLARPPDERLTATLDASWRRLSERLQRVLASLALLCDGADFAAAAAVASDAPTVAQDLLELARRALIQIEAGARGSRVSLLRSVRAFAAARAHAAGWLDGARARYVACFERLAARWSHDFDHEAPDEALSAMRRDRANLLAAWELGGLGVLPALVRLLEVDGPMDALVEVTRAARSSSLDEPRDRVIAATFAESLRKAARLDESHAVASALLRGAPGAGDDAVTAQAEVTLGAIALVRGDRVEAERLLERASRVARDIGELRPFADGTLHLARSLAHRGEHAAAAVRLEDALATAERRGWRREVVRFAAMLAATHNELGRVTLAEQTLARAGAPPSVASDPRLGVNLAVARAMIDHRAGRLDAAAEGYLTGSELSQRLGAPWLAAIHRGYAGMVLCERGRDEEADDALTQAMDGARGAGDVRYESLFMAFRAVTEARRGRWEDALTRCEEACRLARRADDPSAAGATVILEVLVRHLTAARSSALEDVSRTTTLREALKESTARAAPLTRSEGNPEQHFLEVFVAARMLSREGSADAPWVGVPTDRIAVDHAARWLRPVGGEVVDLRRRPVLRALLQALLEARGRGPDARLDRDALRRAGWGEERMSAATAGNRIRVALSGLRDLGLRTGICHDRRGWWLDPQCPIEVVDGE